jgi:hypothetical protein
LYDTTQPVKAFAHVNGRSIQVVLAGGGKMQHELEQQIF